MLRLLSQGPHCFQLTLSDDSLFLPFQGTRFDCATLLRDSLFSAYSLRIDSPTLSGDSQCSDYSLRGLTVFSHPLRGPALIQLHSQRTVFYPLRDLTVFCLLSQGTRCFQFTLSRELTASSYLLRGLFSITLSGKSLFSANPFKGLTVFR